MRVPNSLSTPTIGSENKRTSKVPKPICHDARKRIRNCCILWLYLAKSSGTSTSSSSSSWSSPASSRAIGAVSTRVDISIPEAAALVWDSTICCMATQNSLKSIVPERSVSISSMTLSAESAGSCKSIMRSLSSERSMTLSPFLSYLVKNFFRTALKPSGVWSPERRGGSPPAVIMPKTPLRDIRFLEIACDRTFCCLASATGLSSGVRAKNTW
mmetsp:Transcript_31538/g.72480  ORF Transcript_31538/g.72480 Transcript_31538/m.72480 type:complete len:214 (+) Transcript_31538:418-1059(+)